MGLEELEKIVDREGAASGTGKLTEYGILEAKQRPPQAAASF